MKPTIHDCEEAARAALATLELRAAALPWLCLFDDEIPRSEEFHNFAVQFWNAGIALHWFVLQHVPLIDDVDPDAPALYLVREAV